MHFKVKKHKEIKGTPPYILWQFQESDFSFKVPYLWPFAAVKNEAVRNTIQRQTEGYNRSVNWVTYDEYLQITFEIWGHLRLLLAAL